MDLNTSREGPSGRVFLVSAARTPIGKFGGGLADDALVLRKNFALTRPEPL